MQFPGRRAQHGFSGRNIVRHARLGSNLNAIPNLNMSHNADLAGQDTVGAEHVGEALQYRIREEQA